MIDKSQAKWKNEGFYEKKMGKVLQFRKIVVPLHRI